MPANRLDDAMAYCPDTKAIVYAGADGQVWILDSAKGQWRKAKHSPPPRTRWAERSSTTRRRSGCCWSAAGGSTPGRRAKAPEFRELYAFDPKAETVERLADGPTALYSSHLAYDSKRKLFFAVAVFNKKEQPSGMFAYDPQKDTWREIKPANAIPPHNKLDRLDADSATTRTTTA